MLTQISSFFDCFHHLLSKFNKIISKVIKHLGFWTGTEFQFPLKTDRTYVCTWTDITCGFHAVIPWSAAFNVDFNVTFIDGKMFCKISLKAQLSGRIAVNNCFTRKRLVRVLVLYCFLIKILTRSGNESTDLHAWAQNKNYV